MSISSFRAVHAVALLPFGYLAVSRLKSARDAAFLIATSWLPAIWLIIRLGGQDPVHAIGAFLAGYLAFIAVYELGYLVNDLWDAKRSADGRARFAWPRGRSYLTAFVAIRLASWLVIAWCTAWIANLVWLGGYAALLIALAQHNLTQSVPLRLASFLELAVLRFLLPILAIVSRETLWIAVFVALIPYAYPRFLAYMDSKSVLNLPEERGPNFALAQLAWLAPLVLLIAYATSTPVIAELLAYYVLAYALGSISFRRPIKSGGAS